MLRTVLAVMALGSAAACDKTDPPTSTSAPSPPPAALAPAPPAPPPPPLAWTVSLRSDYGPCSMTDPRSCHEGWTATPDGKITHDAQPNDSRKPVAITTTQLSPADRDALRALVHRPDFIGSMIRGWKCQGGHSDPDATIHISFSDPTSKLDEVQEIEDCTRDPGTDASLSQILALVRRG